MHASKYKYKYKCKCKCKYKCKFFCASSQNHHTREYICSRFWMSSGIMDEHVTEREQSSNVNVSQQKFVEGSAKTVRFNIVGWVGGREEWCTREMLWWIHGAQYSRPCSTANFPSFRWFCLCILLLLLPAHQSHPSGVSSGWMQREGGRAGMWAMTASSPSSTRVSLPPTIHQ